MQAHTVERVESWDSRPFSGGFRELHDLADREFSGAVVADDAWLFMLNGRVVGVFEGDVDDFEDADGTVYEAPHPSLALLFSMQERGGETQAKYYTNDTPLSEASETLADANFTGYIELSENVLSGDYYVVYYGGRSMSAAFVGASEELITDDEAFERADDEVGVYEVIKTPVNVTTIPDVEDDEDDAETAAGGAVDVAGGAAAGDATAESDAPEQSASEAAPSGPDAADTDSNDAAPGAPAGSDEASASASEHRSDAATDTAAETSTAVDETASRDSKSSPRATDAEADAERRDSTAERRRTTADDSSTEAAEGDETPATGKARTGEPDRMFDEEEQWRNATSVPTLDPEKSESTDGGATTSQSADSTNSTQSQTSRSTPSAKSSEDPSGQSRSKTGGATRSTVEKLKRAVKQRDAKLEEASSRIGDLQTERDELRERVESLEAERNDLESQVADLEAALETAREDDGGSEAPTGTELTADAALSGTNLFVRYDSKGKPTLDGLGADTDPSAVNDNLRIDHHTQFEAADATVDGEPFETFLRSCAAYRFVSWAVRELPYEIRDAGHANGLGDLYDAIPAVDRAELDGTVEVDGEEGSVTETFDVVLRDRMGNPLVVAELNAEREPVTGHEMEELVDAATAVSEGADELSAAMYVTASFFEPAALETASEETGGGGFLSRSDKESFVNVARKSGYHLCLVEDRNDAFHLTVPEL